LVVVVVVVLVVAVADGDHSGHGHGHDHVYGHDLLRLLRDYGTSSRLTAVAVDCYGWPPYCQAEVVEVASRPVSLA
jgi:hypothetical protein